MTADPRCLVIENDATDDPRRLGDWLVEGGLRLEIVRAHADEPVPADLAGFDALLVLGGDQHAYPGPDGQPGAPWFPDVEALLRQAVRDGVPTLGVCLGAQLLATALGGRVEPSAAGPEIGAHLVAKRDAADGDPLFGPSPMLPDVIGWHVDEITTLPPGAVLMAASTHYAHQAFRVGARAWGVQFHIECDLPMIDAWAEADAALIEDMGGTPASVADGVDEILDDLIDTWRPFAHRFAAVARGELATETSGAAGRRLPLLGQ